MPRIRQKAALYAAEDFAKEVRVAGCKLGLNSVTAIADHAGMNRDTLQNRMRNPGSFKLKEIILLSEKLKMGQEALSCLAREGRTS